MFRKGLIKILLILVLLSLNQFSSQVCGGSFGAPIFTEDFGSVSSSSQTVSPALQSPAFTNYTYSSTFPPDDGEYTISNSRAAAKTQICFIQHKTGILLFHF